jgi:hypothetical protein
MSPPLQSFRDRDLQKSDLLVIIGGWYREREGRGVGGSRRESVASWKANSQEMPDVANDARQ